MCRGSKLTNSQGQTKLTLYGNNLNFRHTHDQVKFFETAANLCAAIIKQTIFLQLFFHFQVGRYNKYLITSPKGNR